MRFLLLSFPLIALTAAPAFATGVCAHRGDHRNAPENTIPAFVSAVKAGVQQIELDVDSSKDSALVIMHDDTVNRTTNGEGKIRELTFEQIRALDVGVKFDPAFTGTKIPTLREALEVIPTGILCNVHIKGDERTAVEAAKLIREMGRLKQCFLAMGETQINCARAARAGVPGIMILKGWAADREITFETISIVEKPGEEPPAPRDKVNYIQFFTSKSGVPPADALKKRVDELHRLGVKVNYCCGSDEATIRTLIEAGVDYILTDDIVLCKDMIRRMSGVK
jgi:glycerophosphoryl diester phosphodiesterase